MTNDDILILVSLCWLSWLVWLVDWKKWFFEEVWLNIIDCI